MSGIRVSIGVPTIGDNPFVWTALASAIDNLGADRELIVSDNASPIAAELADFTRAAIHPIKIVRQPTRIAMADNWNRCLREARGDYFLLLSDDDVLLPGMVDSLLSALESCEDHGFAYGRFQWIDESGNVFWTSPRGPRVETARDAVVGVFRRKRVVLPSATLVRREDLLAIGGYDASFGNWADMAAWMQVGARYPGVVFDERISIQYRERRTSLTKLVDDATWSVGIDRTLALLDALYPGDALLSGAGRSYREYLLADIRLKRLLVEPTSHFALVRRTWSASDRLALRDRLRLVLKSLYLRAFAKHSDSR